MEIMVRAERHDELLAKEEELVELQDTFRVVSERRNVAEQHIEEKDAEIARLRAALKPFAEFARAYVPIASALAYSEDHILMAAPPAGKPTVLRLSDLVVAIDALEGA